MNNESRSNQETTPNEQLDAATAAPQYDPHIRPAEVAARMEREGDTFKGLPTKESQERARTNDQTDDESIDVTGGYTVDQEGLANNYPIEPEMYVDEPGDLRQEQEQLAAERAEELAEANQDKEGQLTMERDTRGKGTGVI